MKCTMYLFVAILENGRHLRLSIGQSYRMDLITVEMSHAKFGDCITICMIHPKHAYYLVHCKCYNLPQGQCYNLPQGQCYNLPQGQCYNLPQGQCYNLPQGQCYNLPQGQCYNMPQRHLAHDICICSKIRCTLHLASYIQGSV